jgi:arylsulfatase
MLSFLLACRGGTPSATPPILEVENVVLIVADTLRRDRMSAYGAARPTTPLFDARADHTLRMETVFATSNWTLPNTVSILTGAYPERSGIDFEFEWAVPDQYALSSPSLVPAFRDAGLRTALVSGNPCLRWVEDLDAGFDLFDLPREIETGNSEEVVGKAFDWLDSGTGPFFLHLQPFDVHFPYLPPDEVAGTFRDPATLPFDVTEEAQAEAISSFPGSDDATKAAIIAGLTDLYDEELLFLDQQIDRLIEGLDERGLLDETLVVWTADHGELFSDGDTSLFYHGVTLRPGVNRVPLLYYNPRLEPGVSDDLISPVDLLPSLLAAAELPHSDAPDALPRGARTTAYSWDPIGTGWDPENPPMAALTDGRWKVSIECTGHQRGFDLWADPDEVDAFDPTTKLETVVLLAELQPMLEQLHPECP